LWEKLAGFRETGNPTTFDVYLKVFELSPDLIKQAFRYFDYVMLDEAQDTNPVQQSVVVQSGRMVIAVGDSFQQIYQWRGAEDALAKLHGEILYLSQSFRFGYSIAESAWKALMAKPSNRPTVKLRGSKKESVVELVNVAVAPVILCRTNAGLLQAAVYAAKKGRSVHVVGGMEPVSSEIKSAVALLESRTADIQSDVVKRFPTWKDFKAEAESTEDEVLCGLVAAAEDKEVIQDILLLERQHTDSPAAAQTVVSTVHQAKGLEWPIVALHHDFPDENTLERRMMAAQISGNKDLEKSVLESYHIMYVAVTRAQKILRIPARYHGWLGHAACVCR
jgi:hypothetical protein